MATWQFVTDFLTTSPTVSLDINSASTGIWVADGYNLDPPKYTKGYSSNILRHGSTVTSSVAENRNLVIPLVLNTADRDAAATAIQNIGQQIAVDNILKVQFGSTPVFFRTYADPDYAWAVMKTLTQNSKITLTLEADPFAYGLRVNAGSFTVSNNPAAGTNPCQFDISSVTGDVPTPLLLVSTSTGASGTPSGLVSKWVHIGMRRRGTPSGYSNVVQAESMTTNNGAAVVADATFSGGSKIRVTPGPIGMVARLNAPFPGNGVSTVEARGEYRVYARVAKTVAGDTWDIQMRYGINSVAPVQNDIQRLPAALAGPYFVDLGKIAVPAWSDPVRQTSGAQLKAQVAWVAFYAQRVAGTGALDVDFLYFVPADDRTLIVKMPSTDTTYVIDGTTVEGGSVYAATTALDEVLTTDAPAQIVGGGGFPEVIPGQTNRIHFVRHIDPAGSVDALTDTTTIQAYYWPRWREAVRP